MNGIFDCLILDDEEEDDHDLVENQNYFSYLSEPSSTILSTLRESQEIDQEEEEYDEKDIQKFSNFHISPRWKHLRKHLRYLINKMNVHEQKEDLNNFIQVYNRQNRTSINHIFFDNVQIFCITEENIIEIMKISSLRIVMEQKLEIDEIMTNDYQNLLKENSINFIDQIHYDNNNNILFLIINCQKRIYSISINHSNRLRLLSVIDMDHSKIISSKLTKEKLILLCETEICVLRQTKLFPLLEKQYFLTDQLMNGNGKFLNFHLIKHDRLLISYHKNYKIINLETKQIIQKRYSNPITSLYVDEENGYCLFGLFNGMIDMIKMTTDDLCNNSMSFVGHSKEITEILPIQKLSKNVLSSSSDALVLVWNYETKFIYQKFHLNFLNFIDLNLCGYSTEHELLIVNCNGKKKIQIWRRLPKESYSLNMNCSILKFEISIDGNFVIFENKHHQLFRQNLQEKNLNKINYQFSQLIFFWTFNFPLMNISILLSDQSTIHHQNLRETDMNMNEPSIWKFPYLINCLLNCSLKVISGKSTNLKELSKIVDNFEHFLLIGTNCGKICKISLNDGQILTEVEHGQYGIVSLMESNEYLYSMNDNKEIIVWKMFFSSTDSFFSRMSRISDLKYNLNVHSFDYRNNNFMEIFQSPNEKKSTTFLYVATDNNQQFLCGNNLTEEKCIRSLNRHNNKLANYFSIISIHTTIGLIATVSSINQIQLWTYDENFVLIKELCCFGRIVFMKFFKQFLLILTDVDGILFFDILQLLSSKTLREIMNKINEFPFIRYVDLNIQYECNCKQSIELNLNYLQENNSNNLRSNVNDDLSKLLDDNIMEDYLKNKNNSQKINDDILDRYLHETYNTMKILNRNFENDKTKKKNEEKEFEFSTNNKISRILSCSNSNQRARKSIKKKIDDEWIPKDLTNSQMEFIQKYLPKQYVDKRIEEEKLKEKNQTEKTIGKLFGSSHKSKVMNENDEKNMISRQISSECVTENVSLCQTPEIKSRLSSGQSLMSKFSSKILSESKSSIDNKSVELDQFINENLSFLKSKNPSESIELDEKPVLNESGKSTEIISPNLITSQSNFPSPFSKTPQDTIKSNMKQHWKSVASASHKSVRIRSPSLSVENEKIELPLIKSIPRENSWSSFGESVSLSPISNRSKYSSPNQPMSKSSNKPMPSLRTCTPKYRIRASKKMKSYVLQSNQLIKLKELSYLEHPLKKCHLEPFNDNYAKIPTFHPYRGEEEALYHRLSKKNISHHLFENVRWNYINIMIIK
ncbi:hypothetical protein SNEBB_010205 [Seison nebaliae]|nr:hypothetical protein SNEBB_010205 [Seison nebaliae]